MYRSAMRSYIENSNIYKPFLNSVVDEYETFCRVQQERISDLEGLRAEIVAIQDDNKKNTMELEMKHSAQIKKYDEKIVELERRVVYAEKKLAESEEETALAVAKKGEDGDGVGGDARELWHNHKLPFTVRGNQ